MSFEFLLSVPFGVKLKFFGDLKNKVRFFIFFKNKAYSITSNVNHFVLSGSFNFLFLGLGSKFFIYGPFYHISLLLRGFLKKWVLGVKLIGVGYRFMNLKKNSLILKVGLSHLVKFYFNSGIKILKSVKRPTKLVFFCSNKMSLSGLVSLLRLVRLPDNYKGKGFQLFKDLVVIKKREKFGVF